MDCEAALDVTLVSDRVMARLNRLYRGQPGTTDVLSFSLGAERFAELSGPMLGDIVISLDRARVQAREQGHVLGQELDILIAHGLCHLLGYDHQTLAQYRRMSSMEKKALAAMAA